jgi:hypothetical protein
VATDVGAVLTAETDPLVVFLLVGGDARDRLGPGESFLAQLRQGWSEFWSRRWLWAIVMVASVGRTVCVEAPHGTTPVPVAGELWVSLNFVRGAESTFMGLPA